jgi:predicted RNase H-like nuclease (RuvC/YqgF family)
MVEHVLAGSIGAASAHSAIENTIRYNPREEADLKALYSHIVSELQTTEKEDASDYAAAPTSFGLIEELQTQLDDLEDKVARQKVTIEQLEDKLETRYQEITKYRLESQKIKQENLQLTKELNLLKGSEKASNN